MSGVKVIGVGSPYGNDTIGWNLIEKLKRQHMLATLLPEQVELIETDRPGINLIQLLQGGDFVILVDAIHAEHNHGKLLRISKEQLIQSRHAVSSHSLDVANAIALADKLGVLPRKLVIIGMGIDPQCEDAIAEASIDTLADAVTCELQEYFRQAATC